MSNEWDRRGNVDGGGPGGSTVSRSSKPGGGTLVGNRYAGIAPPQCDSTAAAPVQCKNLFASLPGLEENQPVRDDDPLDFTTLYSSQVGATAVSTPIQRRQSLEPATDPVQERAAMLSFISAPVQRRASMSAIDAPRAASLGTERTTIDASPSAATEAPASASRAAAASEQSDEVDAPKVDSLREDRATIGADDGPAGQDGELDASKADSLSEARATIAPDAEAAPGPLSPARARRAAARNASRVARHGIIPADLGTDAAPDSAAFAQAVAGLQQQHGLAVDGVVGPRTAAAVRGSASSQAGPEVAAASGPAAGSSAGADIAARGAGSSLLQMKAAPGVGSEEDVHRAAGAGIASGGESLPHLERIQTAFGAHDVTGIQAHVGGAAASASEAIGAEAYATGNHVAFKQSPDLHTAAHEAAHVVQQRGGVQLEGGVGEAGDSYEQHADAVADKVVRGESAETELDGSAGSRASSAVQLKEASYSQGDNKKLVRLALQHAAASARAGAAEPSAVACYEVANSLRHAVASLDVPRNKSVALRDLFGPADLAYLGAAELHDAASEALGGEEPAVVGLLASMHELWYVLEPAGWQRPANARTAQARGARARRNGSKETFGDGDRVSLVSKSLMTSSYFIQNLVGSGKPITPTAFAVTTTEAHRQIEFAYDQMLDSGKELVSIRDVIARTTRDVTSLEHQALVLSLRPDDLADTVNLANQIRERVGLAPLPPAQLTADEFEKALTLVSSFLGTAKEHLTSILSKTGEAYSLAWHRHTAVLDAQKRQNLADGLLQQAIVTAITGGLGGVAAHVMNAKIGLKNAAVIDGSKDLIKMMVRKGVEVPANIDALSALPLNPLEFFLQAHGAAAEEMKSLMLTVYEWRQALARNSLTDRAFDPHALYLETLTVDGTRVLETPVPVVETEQRAFELALWRTWLRNYAYTISTSYSMARGVRVSNDPFAPLVAVDVDKNWGSEIVEAINELGEDGAAWVREHGGVAKRNADSEKERIESGMI